MTATDETTEQSATGTVRYHWVITLQWPDGMMGTTTGTSDAGPQETRSGLFDRIRGAVIAMECHAAPRLLGVKPNILFFSLEPDEL